MLLAIFLAGQIVGGDIPPKKYDRPFYGRVVVEHFWDKDRKLAAWTYGDIGGTCTIHINKNFKYSGSKELKKTMRHEIGHCNGWDENHSKR